MEQPTYPKHCPRCGERVYPYHHTATYSAPVPSMETWVWMWTARCWLGHRVEPEPEQLTMRLGMMDEPIGEVRK